MAEGGGREEGGREDEGPSERILGAFTGQPRHLAALGSNGTPGSAMTGACGRIQSKGCAGLT